MPDKGHKMTDDMIKELEDKLHELYAKADSDLQKKAASRLKTYNEMVKVKEKTLDKDAFKEWKKNQAYILSNQKSLVDTIADDLVKTDQIALDIINDHTPKAYALNYNYGTYQVEDAGKINTSFALYNHETVELLALYDDSSLLPEKKDLDIPKDLQWNKKHLSQAIAQGVLQGESIDKIAKRLSAAVGMDENGAIRNARTMMTAAQNGGRVDAYLRGKSMGIELQQKWRATEDSRTRKSHRAIDGEVVEVGEIFSNKCHFPGDPSGPGREVYNCRCTLLPLVNGIKDFENPMVAASEDSFEVVDGKDISGSWVRRPDLFDFEIEDVMNAQGFDGKPRIVSADEFDKLVKQANDGKGFIAQRTYSAPDQKTLETYRQQLYEGKWYVDCSTGGAAHGKGMYVVGNEKGEITDKIKSEMLGYGAGNKFSYVETFTIDPSAKFIDEKDINSSLYSKLGMNLTKKHLSDFDLSNDELKFIAAYRGLASDYTPFVSEFMSNPKTNAKAMELMQKMMTDEKMSKHLNDAFDDFLKISSDQGNVAALLGYDGIKCSGGQDYYVILNRTKLIVKAPDDKYIKKGFEDWLKDQADPYITAKFGDKSLNKVYHQLLDEKGSKIGNYFYNHVLGDIGKPSQTWKDYINGTLDTANTKKIDDYLFKHFDLNANKLDDAIKTVDKVDDVSDAIKAAEADVKWTKGKPMSTADADNHKVNPLYNLDDKASKTNCQTCSFVYECRKQGYDVVALPTYDSDSFKDIYHLQVEISHDPSVAWINKTTGKAPKSLYKGSPDYDTIDKLVGNSGERYIFGVKFDGANYHSINLDRDSKGNLRIIDNQRGPKEKNVWTGQKEIEEYFKNLDKVNGIEELVRVDDCVPNAKYLNAIAQDAKKIKNVDPYKNLNHFSEQLPITEIAKKKGFDPEDYYNKWRLGLVEDKDLDDLMGIKSKTVDVTPKVSTIDLDALKDKKVKHIYDELKSEKTHNKFYNELKGIGDKDGIKQAEVWKKYLAGELNDEDTAKIEKYLVKKYAKGDTIEPDIKDTTNNALEAAKKKYNVDKLDDAVEKIVNDPDAFEELYQYASANLNFDTPAELAKKYLKGEVDIPELDKHLATKTTDKVIDNPYKGKNILEIASDPKLAPGQPAMEHLLDDIGVDWPTHLEKWVNGDVEDDILDKYLLNKKIDNVSDSKTLDTDEAMHKLAKQKFGDLLTWSDLEDKLWDDGLVDFAADLDILTNKIKDKPQYISFGHMGAKGPVVSKSEILKVYYDGKLNPSDQKEFDELFAKIVSKDTKTANKVEDVVDKTSDNEVFDFLKKKYGYTNADSLTDELWQQDDIWKIADKYTTELYENTGEKVPVWQYLNQYVNGKVENDELNKHLGMTKATTKISDKDNKTFDADLVKNKAVSSFITEWKKEGNTSLASQWWKTIGDIGKNYGLEKKQSKVWELYKTGKLTDDENKKIEDFLTKYYFNKSNDTVKDITKLDPKLKAAEEKLEKAEKDFNTAKKDLKAAKKALNDLDTGEMWTGIWKDDVTVKDYPVKKLTIKAKKVYYEEEIDKLKNDSNYKSWLNAEQKEDLIMNMEHKLGMLDEFEVEGEKYFKAAKPLQQNIDKAQKVVDDAQDVVNKAKIEVNELSPVDAMYSQERKDAAIWAKTNSEYTVNDKYFEKTAKKVHDTKTAVEHEGYYHYTWGSGPFNQPLAGFDGSWNQSAFKGVGKVDIDKNGYGDKIRGLTSLCEKSKYDKDIWAQTAQDEITIESFLGIKPGTLSNMTETEAQQFIGHQAEIPQFISTAVQKGGGSYNPGDMTVNIYCPSGSEILYVRKDGRFGKSEKEMILQRGATYRLLKIYKGVGTHGRKEWIVDLEVRLEEGYDKFQQIKK